MNSITVNQPAIQAGNSPKWYRDNYRLHPVEGIREANSAKKRADRPTQNAAITIEMIKAGPAKFAAAVPVIVKIPVPTNGTDS